MDQHLFRLPIQKDLPIPVCKTFLPPAVDLPIIYCYQLSNSRIKNKVIILHRCAMMKNALEVKMGVYVYQI